MFDSAEVALFAFTIFELVFLIPYDEDYAIIFKNALCTVMCLQKGCVLLTHKCTDLLINAVSRWGPLLSVKAVNIRMNGIRRLEDWHATIMFAQ